MSYLRRAHFALIICTLLPLAAQAFEDAGLPIDRASSLLDSFEVMCHLATPNFEHLVAQAAAMQLLALEDASETTPSGEVIRRRGWIGTLATGPFALRAEKMSGAKGVSTSCSIEGAVPDSVAFRHMVIQRLHLNTAPELETINGAHTYYWDNHDGPGNTVLVGDMDRPNGHFVRVKLLSMVANGTQ